MGRGGEEDDTGSGCKTMSTVGSDATVGGGTAVVKLQALRLAEDLSLPSVQVVVMSANMGCSHCRQRVTKVVTKMNGLLDYMVDFGKKEVTVRGTVLHTKKKKRKKKHKISVLGSSLEKMPPASASPNISARTLSWFLGCYRS